MTGPSRHTTDLPRGVHQEPFRFGDTRTFIVVDQGEIIRRSTIAADLVDQQFVDELRAWLERVRPQRRHLSLA